MRGFFLSFLIRLEDLHATSQRGLQSMHLLAGRERSVPNSFDSQLWCYIATGYQSVSCKNPEYQEMNRVVSQQTFQQSQNGRSLEGLLKAAQFHYWLLWQTSTFILSFTFRKTDSSQGYI